MMDLSPVSLTPRQVNVQVQEELLGDFRALMDQMAEAGMVTFASPNASIVSTRQSVSIHTLWVHPLFEQHLRPTQGDARDLAESLKANIDLGSSSAPGQIETIIVADLPDPRYKRRKTAGNPDTKHSYMVVSGHKKYYAVIAAGRDYADVEIQHYHSYYKAMEAAIVVRLSSRNTTMLTAGYLIQGLIQMHQIENTRRVELGMEALEDFPNDETLSLRVARSRNWVSIARRLPEQPEPILKLVAAELITEDQLIELLAIKDIKKRIELAQQWAAAAVRGQPVSRGQARSEKKTPYKIETALEIETPAGTLIPGLPRVAQVSGTLVLHDAILIFEQIQAGLETPHPDIKALLEVLKRPSLRTFSQEILANQDLLLASGMNMALLAEPPEDEEEVNAEITVESTARRLN